MLLRSSERKREERSAGERGRGREEEGENKRVGRAHGGVGCMRREHIANLADVSALNDPPRTRTGILCNRQEAQSRVDRHACVGRSRQILTEICRRCVSSVSQRLCSRTVTLNAAQRSSLHRRCLCFRRSWRARM